MNRALSIAFIVLLAPALPPSPAASAGQAAPAGAPAGQAPAGGQAPAPAGQPPAQTAKPSPLEPQGYTYESEGRRDPFISLVRTGGGGQSPTPTGPRPAGLAGMTVDEVSLTGTVKGRDGSWMALLVAVDKKSYLARPGDKLFDGAVRAVSENEMVFVQRVNDPLSLATEREVRKVLRQTEEAK